MKSKGKGIGFLSFRGKVEKTRKVFEQKLEEAVSLQIKKANAVSLEYGSNLWE